jgi:hypothetical protein
MGGGMKPMRAMIIVDMFPPANVVGVHRTVALCRRLVQTGWRVTVITTCLRKDEPLDEQMLADVPQEVRVIRTAAPDLPVLASRVLRPWKPAASSLMPAQNASADGASQKRRRVFRQAVDWLSMWLHTPDGRCGWFLPAVRAAMKEGARLPPQVIYSSGPRWTSHLVAAATSVLLKRPLVADFRDPWCGSAWHDRPAAHERFNLMLERWVVRRASRVTCAWDGIRRRLAAVHPEAEGKIVTILNGFDERQLQSAQPRRLHDDKCVFMHAGLFYGPRSPISLFEALSALAVRRPQLCDELHVLLAGATTFNGQSIEQLAQRHGVRQMLTVMPRVSHGDAIAMLKGANVAMLFGQSGSDELASVPGKTYEFVGAGKPVLAVGAGTEALEVLERGGCRIWRASDAPGIALAVEDILTEHRCGRLVDSVSTGRQSFSRAATADALEQVLRRASGAHAIHRTQREPRAVEKIGTTPCR